MLSSFPTTLKISDFEILRWENYYDLDGDSASSTNVVTTTATTAIWKDVNNQTPAAGDYLNTCNAPYSLTITANDVTVYSEYGAPPSNALGNLTKTFQINVSDPAVCFLKPKNLRWLGWVPGSSPPFAQNSGDPTPDSNQGGGYSQDYVPSKGFKALPVVSTNKFPTTAFVGAEFTILTSPWVGNYTFSTTSSGIFVDPSSGVVKFNTKPTSLPADYHITIIPAGKPALPLYSFTINTWAEPKDSSDLGGSSYATRADAIIACGGSLNNLLTRAELTSSPQNVGDSSTPWIPPQNNIFTRAIGSIAGEWGNPDIYSNNNKWIKSYYWTKDDYDSSDPFVVGMFNGFVARYSKLPAINQNSISVVCRG